jgi:hypothetical protein
MNNKLRFPGQLLLTLLAGVAACTPATGGRSASLACETISRCIAGAICMIVQIPARDREVVLQSEAFEDMQAQAANSTARRKDFRIAVLFEDASRYLNGVDRSGAMRTIFVSGDGRALIVDDLYLDDHKPVEDYFDGPTAGGDPPESMRARHWRLRPSVCAGGSG